MEQDEKKIQTKHGKTNISMNNLFSMNGLRFDVGKEDRTITLIVYFIIKILHQIEMQVYSIFEYTCISFSIFILNR